MTRETEKKIRRHVVADVDAVPPGDRLIFEIEGRSIGLFNVGGRFYAIRNRCPHQGGPLCRGAVGPLVYPRFRDGAAPVLEAERDGEIVKCPWHGWEFDLVTGEAVFGEGVRVASYRAYVAEHGAPADGTEIEIPPAVETYKTFVARGRVIVEVPN